LPPLPALPPSPEAAPAPAVPPLPLAASTPAVPAPPVPAEASGTAPGGVDSSSPPQSNANSAATKLEATSTKREQVILPVQHTLAVRFH
jgi:hypothetical protein